MRNTVVITVLGSIAALALAACGASRQQPADAPRSETTTTSVVVESGPATPGVPAGAPQGGVTSTSRSPASPMEGSCPQAMIHTNAFDRADCVRHCRGLDENVPVGSKCVSQYEACTAQCNRQFRFR